MGKLQKQLEHLLAKVGKVSHGTLPFPRPYDLIGWSSRDQVDDVFRSLGGIAPDIPLNLRRWDFEFNDVVVEFDERLHFNQYRRATLQSAIYNKLQPCPVSAYREYCVSYEEACLKAGGYGANGRTPVVTPSSATPRLRETFRATGRLAGNREPSTIL